MPNLLFPFWLIGPCFYSYTFAICMHPMEYGLWSNGGGRDHQVSAPTFQPPKLLQASIRRRFASIACWSPPILPPTPPARRRFASLASWSPPILPQTPPARRRFSSLISWSPPICLRRHLPAADSASDATCFSPSVRPSPKSYGYQLSCDSVRFQFHGVLPHLASRKGNRATVTTHQSTQEKHKMSNEAPKLYVHKPKKAQLKKHLQQQSRSSPSPSPSPVSSSSSSSMASQSTTSSSSQAPPTPPKESFARRYKFLWPLLLAVNFSIGAYLFMRTKKKENIEEEVTAVTSTPTPAVSTAPVSDSPAFHPVVVEPVKVPEPIPLDQQRELFKWILEEKRKIKPKDPEEKKKLDEEKAVLKQFIRAKSIPPL